MTGAYAGIIPLPDSATKPHDTMRNSTKDFPIIAQEGWPFIAIAVALLVIAAAISLWLAIPFAIIFIFVLQFFRDPQREVPAGDNLVLSPADGRIVAIDSVKDPYSGRDALKISVFMNVFNVHSNRMPVDAAVDSIEYFPGKFFNASLDKASEQNERNAMQLTTPDGQQMTVVQVAGLVAKRILCYVEPGNHLEAGDRYGFIRFGSRVDLYLPTTAKPKVIIGEKVQATATVLAVLEGKTDSDETDTD